MEKKLLAQNVLKSSTEDDLKYKKTLSRLLIKIPTRSRPEQFFKRLDLYYEYLSREVPYHFLISCDSDDVTMNTKEVIKKLERYDHLSFYFGNNTSKVAAYNADIDKYHDWDIVLVTSDDLVPVVREYDKVIVEAMQKHFPEFDGVLNFDDGYCHNELNTYPIIGKNFYKKFGYLYNPVYQALYCDSELTYVSKALHKEHACLMTLLQHYHPIWGLASMDKLYKRNEQIGSKIDHDIYYDRLSHNFDLDALKVTEQCNNNVIKWSILICTLSERGKSFNYIYTKLHKQIQELNLESEIEILFFKDNRERSIGYKRTALLEQSRGTYVCFVDDDDDIHNNYIALIYEALKSEPDCVSLTGIMTLDGLCPKKFIHSIQYKAWTEDSEAYYRCPNHLNPMRRDIAIQFQFPKKNMREDLDWSKQICKSGLLKTEVEICRPYYFYQYSYK